MQRGVLNTILIASPVVLTIVLCLLAFGLHAVGRGLGSSRGAAPVLAALCVAWVLHGGYVLGPWLYEEQREWIALLLMVPVAIVGTCVVLFIAGQVIPENTGAMDGRFGVYCTVWAVAAIAAYLAPIVVLVAWKHEKLA